MDPLHSFELKTLIPISLMGSNLSFTNSSLAMLGTFMMCVAIFHITPKLFKPVRICLELYHDFISGITLDNAGPKAGFLIPFTSTLFTTIFFGNILGMFPKSFAFTAHVFPALALSCIVGITTIIIGFKNQGVNFLEVFCPRGLPLFIRPFIFLLEAFMFVIRIVVMALRLSINITIGHMILESFILVAEALGSFGYLVGFLYIFLIFLELFTAFLQSYIFCILACISLKDSLESHH